MIITTVMYMIFVNSFSKQLSGLFFSKIQNYIGGDMAIIQMNYFGDRVDDTSMKFRTDIEQLDKKDLTSALDSTMNDGTGLLVDYEFIEHSLSTLMNN